MAISFHAVATSGLRYNPSCNRNLYKKGENMPGVNTSNQVFSSTFSMSFGGTFNAGDIVRQTLGPFRVLVDSDFYVLKLKVLYDLDTLVTAGNATIDLSLNDGTGSGGEVWSSNNNGYPNGYPAELPITFFSVKGDSASLVISVTLPTCTLSTTSLVGSILSIPHESFQLVNG